MWNYLAAHWQGRLGLTKSFFVNGVLIFVLFYAMAIAAASGLPATLGNSRLTIFTWLGVLLVWATWACVGAFRCGLRYALDQNGKVQRVGGVLVIAGVVVFAWFTGHDLYYLLVRPLFRQVAS